MLQIIEENFVFTIQNHWLKKNRLYIFLFFSQLEEICEASRDSGQVPMAPTQHNCSNIPEQVNNVIYTPKSFLNYFVRLLIN